MTTINAQQIAELRQKTGLPMMECKKALIEAGGDEEKVLEILKKKGVLKAASKVGRETKSGLIDCYVHGGKIGVMVEVLVETDFVAKNEEFRSFVHDIALHIAAANPKYLNEEEIPADELEKEKSSLVEQAKRESKPGDIVEKIVEGRLERYHSEVCLLKQPFIKDPEVTIGELLTQKIAKIGENIVISRFCRYEIGA